MILKHSLVRKPVLIPIIWIKKIDQMALSNEERFGRTKNRRILLWRNIKMAPIKTPLFAHLSHEADSSWSERSQTLTGGISPALPVRAGVPI